MLFGIDKTFNVYWCIRFVVSMLVSQAGKLLSNDIRLFGEENVGVLPPILTILLRTKFHSVVLIVFASVWNQSHVLAIPRLSKLNRTMGPKKLVGILRFKWPWPDNLRGVSSTKWISLLSKRLLRCELLKTKEKKSCRTQIKEYRIPIQYGYEENSGHCLNSCPVKLTSVVTNINNVTTII